jgi:hypothetical protein
MLVCDKKELNCIALEGEPTWRIYSDFLGNQSGWYRHGFGAGNRKSFFNSQALKPSEKSRVRFLVALNGAQSRRSESEPNTDADDTLLHTARIRCEPIANRSYEAQRRDQHAHDDYESVEHFQSAQRLRSDTTGRSPVVVCADWIGLLFFHARSDDIQILTLGIEA